MKFEKEKEGIHPSSSLFLFPSFLFIFLILVFIYSRESSEEDVTQPGSNDHGESLLSSSPGIKTVYNTINEKKFLNQD